MGVGFLHASAFGPDLRTPQTDAISPLFPMYPDVGLRLNPSATGNLPAHLRPKYPHRRQAQRDSSTFRLQNAFPGTMLHKGHENPPGIRTRDVCSVLTMR